ncbi:MAG: Ig-like domain-containing protein [Calditrichaceae bacterium]|nr:Ig-like domain-containing protein [Calditrichaceae bacterium]MBN2709174.1 Ig-like domain-containing protein [Calditrichaceae bacterium]RQV96130.1 MAG: hypothetical protein EH224_05335 [Calditrichota bacterium]
MKSVFCNIMMIFILFQFWSCATRGAPGGGPVDRIPPEIIFSNPVSDSVNVSGNLDKIAIVFSERMEESSVNRNIFISPYLNLEKEWKGYDELHLLIKDTLLQDQTYVLTIGAGACDEQQNKMEKSQSIAFSTGPELDRGRSGGRVFGLDKTETVSLFVYALADSCFPDPRDKKPLYISQTGLGGRYTLSYIRPGNYRIFAVQDQNNNLLLDALYEKVGIPYSDVRIDTSGSIPEELYFRMSVADTTRPAIIDVKSVSDREVQLRLSEPVILTDTLCALTDSLTGEELKILGLSQNIEKPNIIDLFVNSLKLNNTYSLSVSSLRDSSGNESEFPERRYFKHYVSQDTSKFNLLTMVPKDTILNFRPDGEIFLEFSHPVNWESVDINFKIISKGGKAVTGKWLQSSFYDADFIPENGLTPDTTYNLTLNLGKVLNLWGEAGPDTVLTSQIIIQSSRDLGEMSGIILYSGNSADTVALKCVEVGGRLTSSLRQKVGDPFSFRLLSEGGYRLEGFMDLNNDHRYSYGLLNPFVYAEPFTVLPDTISIRKRWEKAGIELNMPCQTGTILK